MEKPNDATIAFYAAAVPNDARAKKSQMFGHPCAFVNGNMFFGTFGQTVVARVGERRAATLSRGKIRLFEPMPGRHWKEYVQVDAGAIRPNELAAFAREALEWTVTLPPKPERKSDPEPRRAKRAAVGKSVGKHEAKAAPSRAATKKKPTPKKPIAKARAKKRTFTTPRAKVKARTKAKVKRPGRR